MIRTLIAIRYVLFGSVIAGLALLIVFGRHVKYEQSLESFFASDDPAVVNYKKASKTFGNDNIVFVSYDDPDLLTDAGMTRLAELAESLSHRHVDAVVDVQSLDAMPPFWTIDERLIQIVKMPALARSVALAGVKASLGLVGGKGSSFTVARVIHAATDAKSRAELRARITKHPLMAAPSSGRPVPRPPWSFASSRWPSRSRRKRSTPCGRSPTISPSGISSTGLPWWVRPFCWRMGSPRSSATESGSRRRAWC